MTTDTEVLDNQDIPEYRSGDEHPETGNPGGDDVEEQARALGWKPEDEFDGNPGKWAPAEEFLELHSKNNGALRKALAAQAKQLEALQRQMSGMDAAHKKIFDMQIKKQKDEHEQALTFLKAQKREALRDGQHDTAADIEEQIDALRERGPELPDVPETSKAQTTQLDWRQNPTMVEWAKQNPWFDEDMSMTDMAGGSGARIRAANPNMPFRELLDEVAKEVRKAFPHKFQTARRNPVEGATPGATTAATGARTYASLPKDAKAACDEAVSEGGLTQKQWVELYYGYDDRRKR
jgi:hypothetical protein